MPQGGWVELLRDRVELIERVVDADGAAGSGELVDLVLYGTGTGAPRSRPTSNVHVLYKASGGPGEVYPLDELLVARQCPRSDEGNDGNAR